MTRIKKPSEIQEGDWLAKNVKLKTKTLKYSWDGLSKEDVKLLRKEKKNIKVKEGIPFAPAFLIAHILYWLFKDNILNILGI
jgi:prepilin signal peptidase PulO-like enzyme (type II secretory pathway)